MKIRLLASMVLLWSAAVSGATAPAAPGASEWRLLGGSSEQWHWSALDGINTNNVRSLGLAWYADMPTRDGLVGNALVADGVVYQSGAMSSVFANDVKSNRCWAKNRSPMPRGKSESRDESS